MASKPDLALDPASSPPTAMRRWQADLLLILATLTWGGTFLVVQNSLKEVAPFTFIALRFLLGALTLAGIFWKHLRHLTRAELFGGSLIGLFLFGGYAFQTLALQYTTTSKVGFITGLNVVLVPVLSILILRQWPTLGATIGVILAAIGMFLLSTGNSLNLEFGLGETLALGCSICFALQVVLVSRFAPRQNPYNLAIVQIAVTSLLSFLFILPAGEPLVLPPGSAWPAIIFMGVVATAFTFATMNRVQQFTTSTRAALIYSLEPVFAGLFGYLAGETLSLPAWVGCGLIFVGMISSEIRFRKARKVTPEAEPEKEEVAV
ncbi:MAG: EamA family transporter [Chloroflexi bacterium]|nr:EamA family transporter [Chloroflexota bacterium]